MKSIQHKIRRMLDRLTRKDGFTLVESVVTIAIFSLIAAGIYATMVAGDNSWNLNSIQIEVQQELRKAMSGMKDDLMQSGSTAINDVPADGTWYTSITFYRSDGVSGGKILWNSDTTQFLLSGNQLQSIEGSTTKVIAQNIQSLQFRRLTSAPEMVEVTLQAQKSGLKGGGAVTDSLDFKVKLRN